MEIVKIIKNKILKILKKIKIFRKIKIIRKKFGIAMDYYLSKVAEMLSRLLNLFF